MWAAFNILVMNAIAHLVSLFYVSDYRSDIVFNRQFNVIERKASAQNFEFSVDDMMAANALAHDHFPNNFLFGVGSSAYQVEGAYNNSDRSDSVWDYWTHRDSKLVVDNRNGDVACDSFHKYKEDVRLVKDLGANSYRISLSWSRILPEGYSNSISLEGVKYYNNLINAMVLENITPLVTIHHFDIPYKLQMMGGWTSPKMIDFFENYARIVFTYFGDRVRHWITINDPWELCNSQFGDAIRPLYNNSGLGNYLCGHYVLLGHARVYKLYREQFQQNQKGKVGISLSTRWFEPEDYTSPGDADATEVSFQFANYWFVNPLLGERGDYPDIMQTQIGIKSALQAYKASRLPIFTPEEVAIVKGSLDFLGLTFFTTHSVRALNGDNGLRVVSTGLARESLENDMSALWLPYDEAYGAQDVKNTAKNFGKLLKRIDDDYILPEVYITANGYADYGETYDSDRAVYHYDHLKELFEAMKSGVNVKGYTAWSLMDSFEWKDGYSKPFGLYAVDFDNKNRTRKPKLSTKIIKDIYESKRIPEVVTL